MEFNEVEDRVNAAIQSFEDEDSVLLEVDANERSLTHKLAEHLQKKFNDWNVDCEYNRDGFNTKRLCLEPISISSDDASGVTVYPDIIVHKRNSDDNLLVVEAKKINSGRCDVAFDHRKLKGFLSQLHYEFAIFVRFNVSGGPSSVEYERIMDDDLLE